jgi:hypothetical protein
MRQLFAAETCQKARDTLSSWTGASLTRRAVKIHSGFCSDGYGYVSRFSILKLISLQANTELWNHFNGSSCCHLNNKSSSFRDEQRWMWVHLLNHSKYIHEYSEGGYRQRDLSKYKPINLLPKLTRSTTPKCELLVVRRTCCKVECGSKRRLRCNQKAVQNSGVSSTSCVHVYFWNQGSSLETRKPLLTYRRARSRGRQSQPRIELTTTPGLVNTRMFQSRSMEF